MLAALIGCGARSDAASDETGAANVAGTNRERSAGYAPYGSTYTDVHGSADCSNDCSGHDAGYQWAEDNDVSDESDCDGNSESFNEGCRAYVDDNSDNTDDDDADDETNRDE